MDFVFLITFERNKICSNSFQANDSWAQFKLIIQSICHIIFSIHNALLKIKIHKNPIYIFTLPNYQNLIVAEVVKSYNSMVMLFLSYFIDTMNLDSAVDSF
jgi:hypothetical protein